jgi:hypothetical protein
MITPKLYNIIKLPPPLFKEKDYIQKYHECLKKLRNDYLNFNIKYLEESINNISACSTEKENFIARFTSNIHEKLSQFDDHLKSKYKDKSDAAAENIKNISAKTNASCNNYYIGKRYNKNTNKYM